MPDRPIFLTYTRYRPIQRLLHWLVALLVLGSLSMGLTIGYLGFEGLEQRFGLNTTNALYLFHKSFGVLILGLMVVRLLARLILGKPHYAVPLPLPMRIASEIVHGLMYLLLLAMPILGWLATASGDFPVQFFGTNLPGIIGVDKALSDTLFQWHARVAWSLLVLIAIHVIAALYHALVRRDGVIQRMRPW